MTMAQRQAEDDDVDLVQRILQVKSQEETDSTPWMPHALLSRDELDRRFPALEPPEDDGLDDIAQDEDDAVLQHGQELAREIADCMAKHGRTRRDRTTNGRADGHNDTTDGGTGGRLALVDYPAASHGSVPRCGREVHHRDAYEQPRASHGSVPAGVNATPTSQTRMGPGTL